MGGLKSKNVSCRSDSRILRVGSTGQEAHTTINARAKDSRTHNCPIYHVLPWVPCPTLAWACRVGRTTHFDRKHAHASVEHGTHDASPILTTTVIHSPILKSLARLRLTESCRVRTEPGNLFVNRASRPSMGCLKSKNVSCRSDSRILRVVGTGGTPVSQ